MAMPPDLTPRSASSSRRLAPPATVDITGGEPPITYVNTVKLACPKIRIHALILGYWHTIVTPPMCSPETWSR
jgi:hypothetical protein